MCNRIGNCARVYYIFPQKYIFIFRSNKEQNQIGLVILPLYGSWCHHIPQICEKDWNALMVFEYFPDNKIFIFGLLAQLAEQSALNR